MKIKQLDTWPPKVAAGRGTGVQIAMGDSVLGVAKQGDKTNFLVLKMCKTDGQEYSLYLTVPEDLVDRIILTVTPHRQLTLEQMGELEIA